MAIQDDRIVLIVTDLYWYSPITPPPEEEIVLVIYRGDGRHIRLQECVYTEDPEGFMVWRINGGCLDGDEIMPSDIIGWSDPNDIIATFEDLTTNELRGVVHQ